MRAWLLLASLVASAACLAPDASEEALVRQLGTPADMALLHFVVPHRVLRATFEFASFQERPECASRPVHLLLRFASFPEMASNTSLATSKTTRLVVRSQYRPEDALVHAIYNPRPGSYFVTAYLDHFDQQHGLSRKCRYSVGSIGLWSKLEEPVIDLEANSWRRVTTRSPYTYFQFRVPNAIVAKVTVDFGHCKLITRRIDFNNIEEDDKKICLEHVGLRAGGLPFRDATESERRPVFEEERVELEVRQPELDSVYYGMIVSSSQVEVDIRVQFDVCQDEREKVWDRHVSGLKLSNEHKEQVTLGFRLFDIRPESNNFTEEFDDRYSYHDENEEVKETACNGRPTHMLRFDRISHVAPLSVDFKLLRGSWYSSWVTLSSSFITVVQMNIKEPEDLGAVLNLLVRLDDHQSSSGEVKVRTVLLKNQLVFDNSTAWDDKSAVLDPKSKQEHKFVLEYPEPGLWHLGLDLECGERNSDNSCSIMVEIKPYLRPCGENTEDEETQSHECSQCAITTKQTGSGAFTLASCLNSSVYLNSESNKWLLVISNLAFLPVSLLALYLRLFTQGIMALSILISSSLYHWCDQEHQSLTISESSSSFCHKWYMEKEVLQFADFFSATLAFWTTAVSLCHIRDPGIMSALNVVGAIMLALIVHVDRDPLVILLIPVPAGVLLVVVSFLLRCLKRRGKCSMSLFYLWPCMVVGLLLVLVALALVLVFESDDNYGIVHTAWHVVIALALLCFLPLCRQSNEKNDKDDSSVTSATSCES